MPRVDYDQIAHLYDEPIRAHAVDQRLLSYLSQRSDLDRDEVRVLDVGCGTGKQLVANRAELPRAMLVGVDRFRGMLRIAASGGGGIGWVQADGARLPLATASFDYATNQFSYHHIADQPSFVREMFRVLRPGGRFVLTNIDPWSMLDWAIYQYFPEALEQDQRDFVTAEAMTSMMRAAGFVDVRAERRSVQRRAPIAEFLAYASDRHRMSQLMTISDAAYDAGLDRLRRDARDTAQVAAPAELGASLLTVSGDRPLQRPPVWS
jgi:SAM-dependent methyltransferase